jgi:hypothetical protein
MAKTTKKRKEVEEEEEKFYPEEEQGILPEESSEELTEEIDEGEKDEDIYTKEGTEKLEETDEIEPWEEGFVEGARGLGQLGKDALTGQPLIDADDIIEMELDEKMYRFASRANAEKFRKKFMEKKRKK